MAVNTLQNDSAAAMTWDEALAAFQEAEMQCEAISVRHNKVEAELFAEREKVPHVTFRADPHTGRMHPVSTEDRLFVAEARCLVKDVSEGRCKLDPIPSLQEHYQLCKEVAAAADVRDAEIARIDARLGYSTIAQEYDAAVDKQADARDVLITMPAPNPEALLWKLEWLFFSENMWADEYTAQTVADARQFLAAA